MESGFSRFAGKQADDLISQLRLSGGAVFLRKICQGAGHYVLDVPGQCDMGLGGLQFLRNDVGAGRIKAEELRLQAGRDQSLVEPEGEVVIVGHWGGAGQVTRAWPCLSHLVGGVCQQKIYFRNRT
jgi:hypothetical protein